MVCIDIDECARIAKKLLAESRSTVFFGGAGVSTESGIPDFRSADGLYSMTYDVPPETILSHDYFMDHTDEFYKYYRDKMLPENIRPNAAHLFLARLEAAGKLSAVVTQNIDTLHRDAGSRNILELHGSVSRNHCLNCGKFFDDSYIRSTKGTPRCECGGIVKPDVVLYGEALDNDVCARAISAIEAASLLIVAGTSLTVYPAAGFVRCFRGENLLLINRDPTPMDNLAKYVFRCSVGALFEKIKI